MADINHNVTNQTGNVHSNNANNSLEIENRMPDVCISELGFEHTPAAAHETGNPPRQAKLTLAANESLGENASELLEIVDPIPFDPYREESRMIHDTDSGVRFVPAPNSRSTQPLRLVYQATEDGYADLYERDRDLTFQAIDWYLCDAEQIRGNAEATLAKKRRSLQRLFSTPLIVDSLLGYQRPPTLAEMLRPDEGRRLVVHILGELEAGGLGQVVLDLLGELRTFANFIAERGAALPSGINLRKKWGPLVCPLGDGDLKRRKVKSRVFLPDRSTMPDIYEAAQDWAQQQQKKWHAWRALIYFVLCCESGLRGVEACRATLDHQLFDRTAGIESLRNPLNVFSAKNTPPRQVVVEPYGWALLIYWLTEWRPQKAANPVRGWLLPSGKPSRHEPLASASLSETTGRLLKHLKSRGLLHETFTFHSTRKTYATHFLERHGADVDLLLQQCGWSSPTQLGTYVRPSDAAIGRDRDTFLRTLGSRPERLR